MNGKGLLLVIMVIAMVIALAMGLDTLSPLKIAACLLVFLGVGLVNFIPRQPAKSDSNERSPSIPSRPVNP